MGVNARNRWRRVRSEFEAARRLRKEGSHRTISEHFLKVDLSQVVITIKEYCLHGSVVNSLTNANAIDIPNKPKPSIYRVPHFMRQENHNLYVPKLVSIGPLHHAHPHLQSMHPHKLRFLARLLSASSSSSPPPPHQSNRNNHYWEDGEIERLAAHIKYLEKKTRDSYAESFSEIESNDFVLMMIVDGCFVIELLRLYAMSEKEYVDDPIFTTRWMLPMLQRDLLMLENQLPFPVVEKLYELTVVGRIPNTPSLTDLTLNFFDPLLPREHNILLSCRISLAQDSRSHQFHHLLGLFRSTFLFSFRMRQQQQQQQGNKEKLMLIHSVTELQEAGIKFQKRSGHDILDIDFSKGKLKIPHLLIDDSTASVFLNFVALEQCVEDAEPYFTHYVLFFDSLVNSSKDVEILHYSGIMSHVLGSDEEVANLLNNLCKQVVYDMEDCYLGQVVKGVNEYFEAPVHKWMAAWKHDYFSNPWAFISLCAAVLLLLLTLLQTVFSVLSYVRPPSASEAWKCKSGERCRCGCSRWCWNDS